MACPGFRDYHERLQTFLLWFIDAASFIGWCTVTPHHKTNYSCYLDDSLDTDDEKWVLYLV